MKWLWTFWGIYGVYILYQVYSYITGRVHVVNMDIYNAWYVKKLSLAIGILLLSIGLNYFGKMNLAKWVAGVPALILGGSMLLALLAWLFTWFMMWWGGAK